MIARGFPCEVQDLGHNRANFIACFGEGEKTLEYSGHLDIVPCVGDWKHTAIGTTEEGDLIYGRGVRYERRRCGHVFGCDCALSRQTPLNGKDPFDVCCGRRGRQFGYACLPEHA